MRTTQPPTDTTPTPPPTRNHTDNRRYAIYAEHELITIVTATSFYPPAAQTGPNGNTPGNLVFHDHTGMPVAVIATGEWTRAEAAPKPIPDAPPVNMNNPEDT